MPRVTLDSFFPLLLSLEYSVIIIIYNNNDTRSRKRRNKKRERFALTRTARICFNAKQCSIGFVRANQPYAGCLGIPRLKKENVVVLAFSFVYFLIIAVDLHFNDSCRFTNSTFCYFSFFLRTTRANAIRCN